MFFKELSYSILLCASILKHYGYKSINYILKYKDCKELPQKRCI